MTDSNLDQKLAWDKPQLEVLGDLATLTASSPGTSTDGTASGPSV